MVSNVVSFRDLALDWLCAFFNIKDSIKYCGGSRKI